MFVIAALLLANLLRPGSPAAYNLPETPIPVSISASGDSAWAIVGNRVYFVTLKSPGDIPRRIISQIDAQELK